MATLQDLPHELLEKILLQADAPTITLCRLVCTAFTEVIRDSTAIQYKLELAINGYEDGTLNGWSTAEKLEALRSRRSACVAVQPTTIRTINITHEILFTRGHFAWISKEDEFHVLQLPSAFRGIPAKEWAVKGPIVDVITQNRTAMDPDEDILAVAEYREGEREFWVISLRSLTTGDYHPQAKNRELASIRAGFASGLDLTVWRDYVGIDHFEDRGDYTYIYIYNWKTGERLLALDAKPIAYTFVSDQYMLLAHSDYHSAEATVSVIHLPSLPCEGSHKMMTSLTELEPLSTVQLRLPDCECPSSGLYIAATPARPWQKLSTAFHPSDPEDQGVVIHMSYYDWRINDFKDQKRSTLIVPWSAIQRGIQTGQDEQKKRLEWNEWGPKDTAFIPSTRGKPFPRVRGMGSTVLRQVSSVSSLDDLKPLTSLNRHVNLALSDRGQSREYNVEALGDDYIITSESNNSSSEYHILSF
ncbi:hypothetical protein BXZ70DRAFT_1010814 [Cristinia sonorae]|uniref:F-box domain-containing protein n=1 Tax=Cristinia sonorae TaxID=1940300 RepID=A0A8K0UHS5_9AGAR|nr:hypothetical protein BXZ70DRAFT_1010814 [Cristinia sonorae]